MMMSRGYPLYPELTEQGKEEAQKIMGSFKPKIRSIVADLNQDLVEENQRLKAECEELRKALSERAGW